MNHHLQPNHEQQQNKPGQSATGTFSPARFILLNAVND